MSSQVAEPYQEVANRKVLQGAEGSLGSESQGALIKVFVWSPNESYRAYHDSFEVIMVATICTAKDDRYVSGPLRSPGAALTWKEAW